ncbi:MAG: YdcF family protein, partial [Polyangiaceae bacterium]
GYDREGVHGCGALLPITSHFWRSFGLCFRPVELMSLVLLGCRVVGPAALSPTSARRAERALQAFRDGLSQHILACGGKAWGGVREADALGAYLIERGVPARALERELWSRSTRQNAHHAAQLLLPRGMRRIGLVTCDWHLPRAMRCFEGAGFEVEPLPAFTPAVTVGATLKRDAREHVSLALDALVTRGFSRV